MLIGEEPRIAPHRAAMRERLAAALGVASALVNVRATTTDRLGFTGRGEGLAAEAVALLRSEMTGVAQQPAAFAMVEGEGPFEERKGMTLELSPPD